MLTRTICGALLALVTYSAIPQSPSKVNFDFGEEVTSVHSELSQVVDQLSRDEKLHSLADSLAGIQQNQDSMMTTLDQVVASLRKTQTVKYVTKNDLDEAIATAKESVDKVKASTPFGCDCECMSKLENLEARIASLEAKCSVSTGSQYSTKSGGSTGSLSTSSQTYSMQTMHSTPMSPMYTQTVGNGGCTGSLQRTSYSTYAPQPTSIDLSNRTRTVKVVEPMTRRNVTFAEVPQTSDVGITVQSTPQQCYTDENGNRVCPQSVSQPSAKQSWTLGSRFRGR